MILGSHGLACIIRYVVWSVLDPTDVVHIVRVAFARPVGLFDSYLVIDDW